LVPQNTKQETTNKEQGTAQPFPTKLMITFHPQRWTDSPLPWAKELVLQNAKNLIKAALVRWRNG
jgi:uracil-DNA glycosylase